MNGPRHAAILLAAGESRRLGTPKQLIEIDGETLIRRVARFALATRPEQALVVVGAGADAVYAAVADLALSRVECDDWQQGLSASLRAGLAAIDPHIDGALILLCDQPALTQAHLVSLVDRWRADPGCAVASAYGGTVGVPAVLPREWFAELATVTGDRGARELLRRRIGRTRAVSAPELVRDIDWPGDRDR